MDEQTRHEAMRDLEVQITRHRDEIRVKDKEKNDALILAEDAAKAVAEFEARAVAAEDKAAKFADQARELAAIVEAAQTAAGAAQEKEAKAVASEKHAKESLASEREARKALESEVEGLEKAVARLQSMLDEAQPKLAALAVLNPNI